MNSFITICDGIASNERLRNGVFAHDLHPPCTDCVSIADASSYMNEKYYPGARHTSLPGPRNANGAKHVQGERKPPSFDRIIFLWKVPRGLLFNIRLHTGPKEEVKGAKSSERRYPGQMTTLRGPFAPK